MVEARARISPPEKRQDSEYDEANHQDHYGVHVMSLSRSESNDQKLRGCCLEAKGASVHRFGLG